MPCSEASRPISAATRAHRRAASDHQRRSRRAAVVVEACVPVAPSTPVFTMRRDRCHGERDQGDDAGAGNDLRGLCVSSEARGNSSMPRRTHRERNHQQHRTEAVRQEAGLPGIKPSRPRASRGRSPRSRKRDDEDRQDSQRDDRDDDREAESDRGAAQFTTTKIA